MAGRVWSVCQHTAGLSIHSARVTDDHSIPVQHTKTSRAAHMFACYQVEERMRHERLDMEVGNAAGTIQDKQRQQPHMCCPDQTGLGDLTTPEETAGRQEQHNPPNNTGSRHTNRSSRYSSLAVAISLQQSRCSILNKKPAVFPNKDSSAP